MKQFLYLVVFAVCMFLVALLAIPMLISFVFPQFDYGASSIGKADRYLNEKLFFDLVKFLSIDILFVTICLYLFFEKSWGIHYIIILACLFVVIVIITLYPLLAIMNVILMFICKNSPIFNTYDKSILFPYSEVIESNFDIIQNEYITYEDKYNSKIQCTYNQTPAFKIGEKIKNKCWRMIMLKKAGQFTDEGLLHFPFTCQVCDNNVIHNAFFSILDPNVNIPPHIGYYKGYLRYHLGVIIPEENGKRPFINVGGSTYFWKDSQGVLFDDMFYHFVYNPTSQRRVVLYIDLIRPLEGMLGKINNIIIKSIEHNPFIKYFVSRQHAQNENDIETHNE